MIARPNPCDRHQLQRMLEDQLGIDEQFALTQHLDRCPHCQHDLEEMTAAPTWWEETKETLSDVTQFPDSSPTIVPHEKGTPVAKDVVIRDDLTESPLSFTSSGRATPASAEGHWVLDLLEPCESEEGVLGQLDGIPVVDVIGQGGMGVVLKARDPELQRFLAVKLLSPMLSHVGTARQRFLREAQAAAAVVHPNIVPIYAVSAERKLPYLVMPYVGGGNLQQWLDNQGALSLDRTLSIGLQIAEGLAAAHAQGIVHRDVKPANLLLDEGGFRVMLTDFGLARVLDDATLTASGMVAGTPQFMSPEQALGQVADLRSDIYSLGAVLYVMATGHAPVRGSSPLEILRKISEELPRPVFELNETLPDWFQSLVSTLMAPRLQDRLESAEMAADLIRGCLAHVRDPHKSALPESIRPSAPTRHTVRLGSKRIKGLLFIAITVLFAIPIYQMSPFTSTNSANEGNGNASLSGPPTTGNPTEQIVSSAWSAPSEIDSSLAEPQIPEPEKNLDLPIPWQDTDVDLQLQASESMLWQLRMELGASLDPRGTEQNANLDWNPSGSSTFTPPTFGK